jgi:hypothetical protein
MFSLIKVWVKTCYVHMLYLPVNILNSMKHVLKCFKLFNDATSFAGTKERGIKNSLDKRLSVLP